MAKKWSKPEEKIVVGMIKLIGQATGLPGNLQHSFQLSANVINEVMHEGEEIRNTGSVSQHYYSSMRKRMKVFAKGNVKNYRRH